MKTRSSESRKRRATPYERPEPKRQKITPEDIDTHGLFVFAIHKNEEHAEGWVVQSTSPQEAVAYFHHIILKGKGEVCLDINLIPNWEQYPKLHSRIKRNQPLISMYMSKFHCSGPGSGSEYYIELLTRPDQRVGWIPAQFN